MIKLFCGFEKREEPGLHVFISSVLHHASKSVSFIPLSSFGLPEGSNSFTLSRFKVAELCGFKGHAIFADGSDMLSLADIVELDNLFDSSFAVQVVQHPQYTSLHERKYIGTEMESIQTNYERKNWASLMLINCAHPAWRWAALEMKRGKEIQSFLQFTFLDDEEIGSLPAKWNVLVDEGQDHDGAKLLHWTAGIPYFEHYSKAPRAADWFATRNRSL